MTWRIAIALAVTTALTACGTPAPAQVRLDAPVKARVVVIVMENKEASDVIGNPGAPYLNGLAQRYGYAARSYGITHPSLPNYLALVSGSTWGVNSDCTDCRVEGQSIVDQLERARLPWRAYLQGMPHPCFAEPFAGGYAKKHNPFAYFTGVMSDPSRCRRLVPLDRLDGDLKAHRLGAFSFITPDLCADTHDCPLATGDRFLARWVPRLLRAVGRRGYVIVTFDEGSSRAGCCGGAHGGRIATVVAGPAARRGARSDTPVSQYGVLRTVEDTLGLPHLGDAADRRNGDLHDLLRAVR